LGDIVDLRFPSLKTVLCSHPSDVFRPERWADGLAKRLPKFAYFPFGGGPRFCIGNAFAMMEATLLLATLTQRFRFEVAPGARVVPYPSITLRPRYGLEMRVLAR
jgi:cytochrome P450